MSTSRNSGVRSSSGPGPLKKISSRVRPDVCEVRASALRLVNALMRLDLPTLERPAKAISMPCIGGSVSMEGEAQKNCQSPANSFRPDSISSVSGSVIMIFRDFKNVHARDKPGHDCQKRTEPAGYPDFLLPAKVAFTLSNSSIFTPFIIIIALCWSTESVLFQAQ